VLDAEEYQHTGGGPTNLPMVLMDDIAKRGMLSFGCRGIPTYRRRTNQPNQWFLMENIAKRGD
jgi:hypothetical protein